MIARLPRPRSLLGMAPAWLRSPGLVLPLLFLLLAAACVAPQPGPEPAVPRAAAEAFHGARQLRASGAAMDDPELLQVLAEARALAPDWLAPMRMEDDLLIAARRGPDALDRRRQQLNSAPRDASALYLVARLEGSSATRRFAQAAALEPSLAWGQHGLSWSLAQAKQKEPALEHSLRAIELAREPWERAYFELAHARRLRSFKSETLALEFLRDALEAPTSLQVGDRAWFAAEVALFELGSSQFNESKSGYVRGLDLIRRDVLQDADLVRLTNDMFTRMVSVDSGRLELELALAAHDSALRRELRASALLSRSNSALALALYERDALGDEDSTELAVSAQLSRLEAFNRGFYGAALEIWLEELPDQVRAEDGLPRRQALREVVLAGRALDESPAALSNFGEALLGAGWFPEAQAVAESLASSDLSTALSLRERAVAGRVLFDGLARILLDVERGRDDLAASVSFAAERDDEEPEPMSNSEPAEASGGLDTLLERWAALFARSAVWLGGESDEELERIELLSSPRMEYGPFATVLHPGPVFSAEDDSGGLGTRGDAVPGLAPKLERYGRFAIIGEVLGGGGPDGTLLRLLALEEREGVHLGVPWHGTIAWCDGADLLSRAGRYGARISGAALHEGYWIDVDAVRRDRNRWLMLRERFSGERAEQRIDAALHIHGLELLTPKAQEEHRRRERVSVHQPLGEGDRVRLALMRDRGGEAGPLGEVELTELVEAVARHEEGHLCDRARFFPITRNLGKITKLVLDAGFSATAIQEELEYRAHLTALCVVDDSRLPLVELLDTADVGPSGGLPHGAAYRRLLSHLLETLDSRVAREPQAWREVDTDYTLLHQLHRLSSEQVRSLALDLASRRGLIE